MQLQDPQYYSATGASYTLVITKLIKRRFERVTRFEVEEFVRENSQDEEIIFIQQPIPGIAPCREIFEASAEESQMHPCIASFSYTIFNGNADFSYAEFRKRAYFSHARFKEVNFSLVKFEEEANFSNTQFNGILYGKPHNGKHDFHSSFFKGPRASCIQWKSF
ncbi:MAG: pentapeptide repeat-containing protein [Nitrososphaera sp.]